jgi:hypothetical protein
VSGAPIRNHHLLVCLRSFFEVNPEAKNAFWSRQESKLVELLFEIASTDGTKDVKVDDGWSSNGRNRKSASSDLVNSELEMLRTASMTFALAWA